MHASLRRWLACASMALCAAAFAQESAPASAEAGRWRVVAQGQTLAVYDGGLRVKTLDAASRDGRQRSSATSIRFVPARRSFVIGFDALAELWEPSIDPGTAPIFDGLVHDYRMGEGLAEPGFLGLRRTLLAQALRDLRIDDSGAYVLGQASAASNGDAVLYLVQLDIRRAIGRFIVSGDPDLAAAASVLTGDRRLLHVPDRQGGQGIWIDLPRAASVPAPRLVR